MANFTEKAIKESFIRLLNDMPLTKITVKDIVEDCGINRNSFYYHYQDVPSLLNQIIVEQAEHLIRDYPSVEYIENAMDETIDFFLNNKNACLHVFNSVSRDVFEQHLARVCEDSIAKYIDTVFPDMTLSEDDRRILIGFLKCEFFGVIINWMNGGMKTDLKAETRRFFKLLPMLMKNMLELSDKVLDK